MASAVRWTWSATKSGWSKALDRLSEDPGIMAQHSGSGTGGSGQSTRPTHLTFPAFWSFFTSRYTIALIVCAAIANRIIAIVPPNLQIPYRSSAKTRALVRAPAIFLLSRACILILGMLARLSDAHGIPGFYSVKATALLGGAEQQGAFTHAEVLWACFIAACTAVACESFVRALDRDLAATIPINLFSLGLLLHYHSLPNQDPIVPPTRQVYILLLLSLAEILSLHLIAIPGWRARLPVTAAFAIASRGAMVYFWFSSTTSNHAALVPAIQSLGRILPEAFFVGSSVIFVVLRALVQLITEGRLSMDMFGHSSALPHRDDDFILALIKYGTATLETTAMKGLNNEVSMLSHPASTYIELHAGSESASSAGVMGTGQVLAVHPSYNRPQRVAVADPWNNEVRLIKPISSLTQEVDPMSKNATLRKEMWRFIKALHLLWKVYIVGYLASKTGAGRLASGHSRTARFLRRIGVLASNAAGSSPGSRPAQSGSRGRSAPPPDSTNSIEEDGSDEEYLPKSADEADSDDVDDDEDMTGNEDDGAAADSDSDENFIAAKEESHNSRGATPIQSALVQMRQPSASRESTPGLTPLQEINSLLQEPEQQEMLPMLIAHLQAGLETQQTSPLTRRRYQSLLMPRHAECGFDPADRALVTSIATRRQAATHAPTADRWDDTTFQAPSSCVVCCAEPRTIVLWPCRCLALCNDCRGELAARSSQHGGSSLCPCCRTAIQGYSRILIP